MTDAISKSWLPINSKAAYRFYLEADRLAIRIGKRTAMQRLTDALGLTNPIWRYLRLLRKAEYINNCKTSFLYRLYKDYLFFRLERLGIRLGFTIPVNVFGPGLRIIHHGTIIVNANARVCANCGLHNLVHIAANTQRKMHEGAPTIGDNVFIGPGSRIFGEITVADGVVIGANSVVTKSVLEPHITVAGVQARVISDEGSETAWRPQDRDALIRYVAAHEDQFAEK